MVKKVLFAALVLFGLVFSEMAGECFADASAQLGRAKAYRAKGCYEQAEGIFKTVAADYPGTDYALEAQKRLAMLYIESGQVVTAQATIDSLTAGFSERSDLPAVLCSIAEGYGKSWKYEEAKTLFQQIIQQYPDSKYARKAQLLLDVLRTNVFSFIESGDDPNAQAAIDKLVKDFSGHSALPSALYWIGKRYESLEKYEEAKSIYQNVVTNYPSAGSAFWAQKHLIIIYIDSRDYTAAQTAIDKLVKDFSGHSGLPEVLCSIGARYKEYGKYEEAKNIYQQVIEQYPDSPYVHEAQLGVSAITGVLSLIESGQVIAAEAAIDNLVADFNDHPGLPEAAKKVEKYGAAGKASRFLAARSRDAALAAVGAKAARINPWLGKVARHSGHAGGPHKNPHIQIMIRTGKHTTKHFRIP